MADGTANVFGGRPAAFLDRDGVINVDEGYTFRPETLRFTPTAVAGIRALNEAGYLVLDVTNQSGVARGYYTEEDVDAFHAHMAAELARDGARVDAFYSCCFHPDGTVERYAREHDDRKPGAGMILRAARDWSVDLSRSFLVGDKDSDMAAAAAAGIPGVRAEANRCDLLALVEGAMARSGFKLVRPR